MARTRPIGINHVALEVGDLDAALEWYARFLDFDVPERLPGMAFIGMGDQFLALAEGRRQPPDDDRHFGLVVDDKAGLRAAMEAAGDVDLPAGRTFRFLDPWGNQFEVVGYQDVQFTRRRRYCAPSAPSTSRRRRPRRPRSASTASTASASTCSAGSRRR